MTVSYSAPLRQMILEWSLLEFNADKQNAAIEALAKASDAEQHDLQAEICHYVLHEQQDNLYSLFSAGLQMSCLDWLLHYRISQLNAAEQLTPEMHQAVTDCLQLLPAVVEKLPFEAALSKAEMEEYNNMMQFYYENHGLDLSIWQQTMLRQSMHRGDIDAAKDYFSAWQKSEQYNEQPIDLIIYYHFMGQYRKALSEAESLLESAEPDVLAPIYYPVIDSFLENADWEQAAQLLSSAISAVEAERAPWSILPQLMQLQLRLGESNAVFALAEKHHKKLLNLSDNHTPIRLDYCLATAHFDDKAKEFAENAAQVYDERNGNRYFSQRVRRLLDIKAQ